MKKIMASELKEAFSDFIKDNLPNLIKEQEREFKSLQNELRERLDRNVELIDEGLALTIIQLSPKYIRAKFLNKNIKRLKALSTLPKKSRITDEMIESAKEVPMSRLVEHKNYFVKCPFHNDGKKPNMYVKGNYYHCFSCGESGDTIAWMMEVEGYSFIQAVKELNTM